MAYTPYQPYDWETGEVITEGKLDHIEEGLVAAGEQIAENESDIAELNEQMPTKASIDQSYPDLGAGYTTTLKPTKYTINQEPYLFRRALGARLTSEKIVGGTVAWNQLIKNGNFETSANWAASNGSMAVANNECTLTATDVYAQIYQVIPFVTGHKVLLLADVKAESGKTFLFYTSSNYFSSIGGSCSGNYEKFSKIVNVLKTGNPYLTFLITNSASGDEIKFKNAQAIDLTLAFNPTIADHIYALEQAQAGAGVAFLRNNGFMTKDYYAYDAGSLESVLTSGHRTVGLNQWDEQWETGGYNNDTGTTYPDSSKIRSKNADPIPVLPNTVYSGATIGETADATYINILFYDADDNFISKDAIYNNHNVTTPSNAYKARFYMNSAYGRTYKNNICINLSSDRNGEYEPFEEHLYPLSPVSLRGIMTLSDGKLKNDGDERYPDGTVKRNYKRIVFNGDGDWHEASISSTSAALGLKRFYTGLVDIAALEALTISSYLPTYSGGSWTVNMEGSLRTEIQGRYEVAVLSSRAADVNEWKSYLSTHPIEVLYKLNTPTTETTDPYQSEQTCSEYGTEAFIDERDVPIPVGHVTEYWPDLTAKIEALPDVTAIAPVEDGTTASKAYTAGQYFFRGGEFCKAKTNIASGATFTLNTNYEVTTIAAELYAALNS